MDRMSDDSGTVHRVVLDEHIYIWHGTRSKELLWVNLMIHWIVIIDEGRNAKLYGSRFPHKSAYPVSEMVPPCVR